MDAVDLVLKGNLEIKGITAFNLSRIVNGALDLEAIEKLLDWGATLHSLWNLHAKVYVFDHHAVVTSANLTYGGLRTNVEFGVMINDPNQVKSIRAYLKLLSRHSSKIDRNWIETARKLRDRIPLDQRRYRQDIIEDIPLSDETIAKALLGWDKEVFSVLCGFHRKEFPLSQVYSYKEHFSKIYPKNRFVEAKIRQTLQHLRDMGLLEFVKPGFYRRITGQL